MSTQGFNNASCSICHNNSAKWLCKCANESLCQEGICIATHLAKASRAHVLVEYDVGVAVTNEEAAACFQSFDQAVEVTEFLKGEVRWLSEEKDRISSAIDRQVDTYCEEIRAFGRQKKEKVEEIMSKMIEECSSYKSAEHRDFTLDCKRQKKHIQTIACTFGKLTKDDLIVFDSGQEKTYQLATSAPRNNWSFAGSVDAITIKVSKNIQLTALSLTKASTSTTLTLSSLDILRGSSTKGEVIYSHGESVEMTSQHTYKKIIRLKCLVSVYADSVYTIRALLRGGNGYATNDVLSGNQNGLTITVTKPSYSGGDKDNGSGPASGIFCEFIYTAMI